MMDLCTVRRFHMMDMWEEPEWVQWGTGSKMVQRRKCSGCNKVEFRDVMVGRDES